MEMNWATVPPDEVLDFWFPDDGHDKTLAAHQNFWALRMRGGLDRAVCDRFGAMTQAAAQGRLDHWATTARGRLALLVVLDQFSRSVWRDTPNAFAQDIKATRLALEGLDNGHYHALKSWWEREFFLIAISHCEGPDHLQRLALLHRLTADLGALVPAHLIPFYDLVLEHDESVFAVISAYGRHPHRNTVLQRITTDAEAAYLETGTFPHQSKIPVTEPADAAAPKLRATAPR
jgi:uncharacterized protein (DUF924 family)